MIVARSVAASLMIALITVSCGGGETDDTQQTRLEDVGIGDPQATQVFLRRQQLRVEEIIGTCMASEGWEYVPYVPAELDFGPRSGQDIDEAEYAAQYGYGIATLVDEIVDADVFDEDANPNSAVYDSLTAVERSEYNMALYGDEDRPEGVFGRFTQSGGCTGAAQREVYGEGGVLGTFQDLGESIDELQERISADDRIVALNTQWSGCMAEQGFDFGSSADAQLYVQTRVQAVVLPALFGDQLGAVFGGEGDAPAPDAGEIDDGALAELREEEISIAVADHDCRQPLADEYDEVTAEYEAEFIAENAELIDRLRGTTE